MSDKQPDDPNSLHILMFKEYPDVVNIEQLCTMLGGISTKTGYKILQANCIPHFKIGRAYRIPKIQIIAYLQSLMNPEQPSSFNTLTH
ncbi:helix-turn-helix domain-containing protein [Paenibacillus humicus]|uniref:helix-turn-helix domain-containing protein n=1 Tax=Paenibacillus humicus TaxID=412861 RepID=UPI003F151719